MNWAVWLTRCGAEGSVAGAGTTPYQGRPALARYVWQGQSAGRVRCRDGDQAEQVIIEDRELAVDFCAVAPAFR